MKTLPNDPIITKPTHHTQSGDIYYATHHGLTKLEYAAIQAMEGVASNPIMEDKSYEQLAIAAVGLAKALFNELNKNEQDGK